MWWGGGGGMRKAPGITTSELLRTSIAVLIISERTRPATTAAEAGLTPFKEVPQGGRP